MKFYKRKSQVFRVNIIRDSKWRNEWGYKRIREREREKLSSRQQQEEDDDDDHHSLSPDSALIAFLMKYLLREVRETEREEREGWRKRGPRQEKNPQKEEEEEAFFGIQRYLLQYITLHWPTCLVLSCMQNITEMLVASSKTKREKWWWWCQRHEKNARKKLLCNQRRSFLDFFTVCFIAWLFVISISFCFSLHFLFFFLFLSSFWWMRYTLFTLLYFLLILRFLSLSFFATSSVSFSRQQGMCFSLQ